MSLRLCLVVQLESSKYICKQKAKRQLIRKRTTLFPKAEKNIKIKPYTGPQPGVFSRNTLLFFLLSRFSLRSATFHSPLGLIYIIMVRLCRLKQAYDLPATCIVSRKSNLQLAYACCACMSQKCRRILKHAIDRK